MAFASVVIDIPTRALDRAYDYAVPPMLDGEVYVVYPDADRTVHILDTLRVEFYGRHYQKQPTTAALKGEDGLIRQYEFTQTITRVRDVRKSHGEELA